MNFLPLFIVMLLIGGMAFWSYYRSLGRRRLGETFFGKEHFPVGKYLVGLEKCDRPTENIECIVAPHELVFATLNRTELGRIPRNKISEVLVDDKSQISQRLTATRIVLFGVFALAAPKRKKIKEWCVAVGWEDVNGLRRAVVFEFTGANCEGEANRAANAIMRFVIRDQQHEVKQCPFCAETIKAAAKVCRFCNRDLATA